MDMNYQFSPSKPLGMAGLQARHFWGAVIGGALGAAGSMGSTAMSNSAAAASTKRALRWNLYMDNTKHQRQVEDLRKAGLNPILSAGGTPSVPHTNPAQVFDYSSAVGHATQAFGKAIEGKLAKSNIETNNARQLNEVSAAVKSMAEADSINESTSILRGGKVAAGIAEAKKSEVIAGQDKKMAESWWGRNVAAPLRNFGGGLGDAIKGMAIPASAAVAYFLGKYAKPKLDFTRLGKTKGSFYFEPIDISVHRSPWGWVDSKHVPHYTPEPGDYVTPHYQPER